MLSVPVFFFPLPNTGAVLHFPLNEVRGHSGNKKTFSDILIGIYIYIFVNNDHIKHTCNYICLIIIIYKAEKSSLIGNMKLLYIRPLNNSMAFLSALSTCLFATCHTLIGDIYSLVFSQFK